MNAEFSTIGEVASPLYLHVWHSTSLRPACFSPALQISTTKQVLNACFFLVKLIKYQVPVNIHTHLWGSVLFLYFLATFYPTYVESHVNTTWKDVTVIAIFLASGVICLAASAFYHTSRCHSKEVRHPHVASFCVKLTFLSVFIRLLHIVMPMTTPGLLFSL